MTSQAPRQSESPYMNVNVLLSEAGMLALSYGYRQPKLTQVLEAFCTSTLGRAEIDRLEGSFLTICEALVSSARKAAVAGLARPNPELFDDALRIFIEHLKSRMIDDEIDEFPNIELSSCAILSSIIRASKACAITRHALIVGDLGHIVQLETDDDGVAEDLIDLEDGIWGMKVDDSHLPSLVGAGRDDRAAASQHSDSQTGGGLSALLKTPDSRPAQNPGRPGTARPEASDPDPEARGFFDDLVGDDPDIQPDHEDPEDDVSKEDFGFSPPPLKGPAGADDAKSRKKDDGHEEAVISCLRNLSEEAARGEIDPVIGRQDEIAHVMSILRRRRKSSVILSGDAGVGKTAIAEGLAVALRKADVEPELARRPVFSLSLTDLVAGTKLRGDFETRMSILVRISIDKNAILFIDEIHNLIGSGSTFGRNMDGANLLKPALSRGQISVIGATTTEEARIMRTDTALMRRFDVLLVKETSPQKSLEILRKSAWSYLDHHKLTCDETSYGAIIDICASAMPARKFPDKAFDLLDMACVVARNTGDAAVTVSHVRLAAARLGARIPRLKSRAENAALTELAGRLALAAMSVPDAHALAGTLGLAVSGISEKGVNGFCILAHDASAGHVQALRTTLKSMGETAGWPVVRVDLSQIQDRSMLYQLIGSPLRNGPFDSPGDLIAAGEKNDKFILHVSGIDAADHCVQDVIAKLVSRGAVSTADGRSVGFAGAFVVLSLATKEGSGSFGFGGARETGASETLGRLTRVISQDLIDMASCIVDVAPPCETEETDVRLPLVTDAIAAFQSQMAIGGLELVIAPSDRIAISEILSAMTADVEPRQIFGAVAGVIMSFISDARMDPDCTEMCLTVAKGHIKVTGTR